MGFVFSLPKLPKICKSGHSIKLSYELFYSLNNQIHLISGAPRGFGDLGRMAIYFQGAGEHW